MRIICPTCASQYEVDASLFPEEGREVQCSNCENVWVQGPPRVQPMRLDAAAAPAPRPSEQLAADERDALRSAAEEEVRVRDADRHHDRDHDRDHDRAAPEQPADDNTPDDDEILSSLRKQIAAEGGDFETSDGPALSQKRNLRKAAEAVGIEVEDPPAPEAKDEKKSESRWGRKKAEKEEKSDFGISMDRSEDPARSKLAQALSDYEHEVQDRRRGRFRMGFATAAAISAIGFGIYMTRDAIQEAYPPVGPYLDTYAGVVDQGRDQAEALYAEYGDVVLEKISDVISSGGEEAPAE